jgi:hypothetical protein
MVRRCEAFSSRGASGSSSGAVVSMPLWSPSLSAPLSSLPPPLLLTSTASSSPASSSPSSFSRSSASILGTRKKPSVLCRIFQEQQRHGERERAACLSSPLSTRLERRKMSNDSCHCRCSEEKGDTTHSFSFPSRALPVPRARLSDFDLGTLTARHPPPKQKNKERASTTRFLFFFQYGRQPGDVGVGAAAAATTTPAAAEPRPFSRQGRLRGALFWSVRGDSSAIRATDRRRRERERGSW